MDLESRPDTMRLLQIAGAVLVAGLLSTASFYAGRGTAPDRGPAPPDTDSVRVAVPDTTDPIELPDVVTVYDTIEKVKTRVETMRVPIDFQIAGVFQGEPLRQQTPLFGPDRYTFTYFDPNARRFKQKTYEAGRPEWALWPEVEIRTTPRGLMATSSAAVRWKGWTLTAGYTLMRDARGWTASIRWRPFSITP